MKKNSTKANAFKVKQGSKVEVAKSAKALNHKDIKRFLAKFAEAILVDQERVDKLPRKSFHPFYNKAMWVRNRDDHIRALVDLSMTVDQMPKRLLENLAEFAVSYEPEAVKQQLLNIISDLATRAASPWLYETASMFFEELIKDVKRVGNGIHCNGSPTELMMEWFNYDDPIRIAEDPECQYLDLLTLHIQQETENRRDILANRGRLGFIEMRVAREFCDDLIISDRQP
jgi:hypothetical protein